MVFVININQKFTCTWTFGINWGFLYVNETFLNFPGLWSSSAFFLLLGQSLLWMSVQEEVLWVEHLYSKNDLISFWEFVQVGCYFTLFWLHCVLELFINAVQRLCHTSTQHFPLLGLMFYMVSWQADRAAVYKLKALIKYGGIITLLWESYASGIFQSKILRK